MTKTIRSRFAHEVGEKVEGCTILERSVIIPPDSAQRRLGVYDYLVEVPPVAAKPQSSRKGTTTPAPVQETFTRSTPDEMGGVIRRLPSR